MRCAALSNQETITSSANQGGKGRMELCSACKPTKDGTQRKMWVFIQVNFQDNLISKQSPRKQGQQGLNLCFKCTPLRPVASKQTPGQILHQHTSAQLHSWGQQSHVYFYQLRIWSSLLRRGGTQGVRCPVSLMLLPTPNTWHQAGLGSLGWGWTSIPWQWLNWLPAEREL